MTLCIQNKKQHILAGALEILNTVRYFGKNQVPAAVFLFACILFLSAGAQPYYGYNSTGDNYDRLFQYPQANSTVAHYLWDTPASDKVLRFPDGQESLNDGTGFPDQRTGKFIDFCLLSGVEYVVLRADLDRVQESIEAYERLSADLTVLYVEAGNEPYGGINLTVNNFREWLLSIFNQREYHKVKARQYSAKVRKLYNAFRESGHEIKNIYAIACPVPKDKFAVWYQVINSELRDVSTTLNFHLYGKPDQPYWLNDQLTAIGSVDDRWAKISTEFSAIHFGRDGNTDYATYAYTEAHALLHGEIVNGMLSSGFGLIMYHKLFGESEQRFFSRLVIGVLDGSLHDRQPGWHGIPQQFK